MLQNFYGRNLQMFKKVRMSVTGFSNIVLCLWVRQGAYPRVERLKWVSYILTLKYSTRQERPARDKH
jgi:hypothetical protein